MLDYCRLFGLFFLLGSTNFGGPAIIPYLQAAVLRRGIISPGRFGRGLAVTEILPGSTILQLSAYVGQEYRGVYGAIAAFSGMAMPSFLMMLGLSWLYVTFHNLAIVKAVLACMDAVIVVIILQAAYMAGTATLQGWRQGLLAAIGFIFFLLKVSSVLVLGGCAVLALFLLPAAALVDASGDVETFPRHLIREIAVLCLLQLALFGVAFWWEPRMGWLALDMAKASLLSFGGGFATIPIFLHDVVHTHHWLTEHELMVGITLGQVTPGPVIIAATFIGDLLHGFWGAVLATVCILGPSFILVVAIGPVFGAVGNNPWVRKAVGGILSGFIGMLVSVAFFLAREVQWNRATILTLGLSAALMLWKKPSVIWLILMAVAIALANAALVP